MKRVIASLLFVLATVSLWAHHATTAVFDLSKKVTVTGTLTKVDWVNPHIVVSLEAKGESWRIESNPPSFFRRVSVGRADFAKGIGQTVTIEANPAKDGTKYAYLTKVTFADGTSLEVIPENGARP